MLSYGDNLDVSPPKYLAVLCDVPQCPYTGTYGEAALIRTRSTVTRHWRLFNVVGCLVPSGTHICDVRSAHDHI